MAPVLFVILLGVHACTTTPPNPTLLYQPDTQGTKLAPLPSATPVLFHIGKQFAGFHHDRNFGKPEQSAFEYFLSAVDRGRHAVITAEVDHYVDCEANFHKILDKPEEKMWCIKGDFKFRKWNRFVPDAACMWRNSETTYSADVNHRPAGTGFMEFTGRGSVRIRDFEPEIYAMLAMHARSKGANVVFLDYMVDLVKLGKDGWPVIVKGTKEDITYIDEHGKESPVSDYSSKWKKTTRRTVSSMVLEHTALGCYFMRFEELLTYQPK